MAAELLVRVIVTRESDASADDWEASACSPNWPTCRSAASSSCLQCLTGGARLRQGSYLPSFLEPRRRAEKALAAVVAQCYVEGVSTRRVEDIAQAMGVASLSKSPVSRVCIELDEMVAACATGPWMPARTCLYDWTPW
jgi:hypothetical protein